MPALFALTMFVSATLLFMIQPMVGKMVLPYAGGSPAVWNTCMIFFQALLLGGYWYAHKIASISDQRKQVKIHLAVLLCSGVVLVVAAILSSNHSAIPILKSLAPEGGGFPFLPVMAMLTVAIAIPFFAISTSAPLLQRWFAVTGHTSARDPYFLYAASNAGSLISLLGYPLFLEPGLRVVHQTWLFASGFLFLVGLTLQCGRVSLKPLVPIGKQPKVATTDTTTQPEPTAGRKLMWLLRAFVPSSLMLGVTTHMTTDIASLPLLWVIPLALYLLTFIIAFAKLPKWFRPFFANAVPVVTLLMIFITISGIRISDPNSGNETFIKLGMHLAFYFLMALLMHSELAHDRPDPKHLTGYFLRISLGGVCGGIFNGLFAPLLFTGDYEYSLAIALGCILIPTLGSKEGKKETEVTETTNEVAAKPQTLTDAERNKAGMVFLYDFLAVSGMFTICQLLIMGSGKVWFKKSIDMVAKSIGDLSQSIGLNFTVSSLSVASFTAFAPPCLICFLYIDRPIRFGLCVLVILGLHEYRTWSNSSTLDTFRSYFGTTRIYEGNSPFTQNDSTPTYHFSIVPYLEQVEPDSADESETAKAKRLENAKQRLEADKWRMFATVPSTSMTHGTTLHGRQFKGPFEFRSLAPHGENVTPKSHSAGMLPCLNDDLRLLGTFSPWEAVALAGARAAWDPTKDPLTYYHRTGPVGLMMAEAFRRKPLPEIGMVGLGTGSAAAYAIKGQTLNFYEIDVNVRDMVLGGKYFTYVNDAKARGAKIDIVMGDARLMLEKETDRKYDLLLIDAFSSDSIPVHLLTGESLKLYRDRLAPNGFFALHISNQYLKLEPVVAAIAEKNGLVCRILQDADPKIVDPRKTKFDKFSVYQQQPGKSGSSWVVLAPDEATLGKAFIDPPEVPGSYEKPAWTKIPLPPNMKPWTDDYQNLLLVLRTEEYSSTP